MSSSKLISIIIFNFILQIIYKKQTSIFAVYTINFKKFTPQQFINASNKIGQIYLKLIIMQMDNK